MSALRVVSLFSGIGGIDLGLERAGMQIVAQVEIDEWCRRVLAKHWPDVPRFGDIRTVAGGELPAADVVAGGFPCQSVSLAGRRQGQIDARWLWPEFIRIVRVVRPRFVLVENTPGLLSLGMGDVLGDLAACGYDAEWDCIPAAAVGAPHLRERVWIVAYSNGTRRLQPSRRESDFGQWSSNSAEGIDPDTSSIAEREQAVSDITLTGSGDAWPQPRRRDWWASEPQMERMAYGIPGRVDSDRGLGNAVVPQVVEHIGRMIVEAAA